MAYPGLPSSSLPNTGIDAIPRKIRDLERSAMEDRASVAQSFGPVMASLAAKQATLEAQQVALAAQDVVILAQQAALADVVANQVTFDGKTSSTNTGVVGAGTYTTMLTVTLAAPAWATKAMVTCSAVVSSTSIGAAAGIWGRITVDGTASENFESIAQTAGESLDVTPLFFRSFDPGSSVVVNLDTRTTVGTAGSTLARLVATALYLR